ncbi:hypothetical protein [Alicyclobacillus macrosporangiidus]|uniref:hypothetical protein n=1 Tax=Alicyclobacillus macrosporangiidus TaxID=392015 RepID=UPI000496978B|nr:hypothetical protein [Alicyclobacillus macrosporangiidus]
MEVTLNALICGLREVSAKDGRKYFFVDWYCGGAHSSIIDPDKVEPYKTLAARLVTMRVRIEEGRDRVNYRILDIQPVPARQAV